MFLKHFKSILYSIMHRKVRFNFRTAIFGLFFFALSSCEWFNNLFGNRSSAPAPQGPDLVELSVTPHGETIKTLTVLLPGINDDPNRDEFQKFIEGVGKKCNSHGVIKLVQPLKAEQNQLSLENRTKNTIQKVKTEIETFARNNPQVKEIRLVLGGYSLGGVTALDAAIQIKKEIPSIKKGKDQTITVAAGFTINAPMGGIQKPNDKNIDPFCKSLYERVASGVGNEDEQKKLETNSVYFKQLHAQIARCGFPILSIASFVDTSLLAIPIEFLQAMYNNKITEVPAALKEYLKNSDGVVKYNSQIAIHGIKGLHKDAIAIQTYTNYAHGETGISNNAQNQLLSSILQFLNVKSILREEKMHHLLGQFILNPAEAVTKVGIHM